MTKKYKELPAFETNEFKVGDIVNCYCEQKTHIEIPVKCLLVDKDYLLIEDRTYQIIAHFKQCRKLVKVEPREFWLVFSHEHNYSNPSVYPCEQIIAHKGAWQIKVREVLDEDTDSN